MEAQLLTKIEEWVDSRILPKEEKMAFQAAIDIIRFDCIQGGNGIRNYPTVFAITSVLTAHFYRILNTTELKDPINTNSSFHRYIKSRQSETANRIVETIESLNKS